MDNGKFIRCRKCGAVYHVTFLDGAPASHSAAPDENPAAADWRAFMRAHAGHLLESLTMVGEATFVKGAPGDPMSVAYVTVSNGRENYLLRRARANIAEPLKFEVVNSL
jgi:hypothetical protein